MKIKETITKENYKEKTLKRAIIVCWILLAICFVIKICGGNFFDIVCNNENFIKFCNYCDTSFIRYVIYFIYFMFESLILLLIVKPNVKIKTFLSYFICIFVFWIVKVLYDDGIIKTSVFIAGLVSLIVLYFLLLIFSRKPLWSALIIIYQTILGIIASYIKSISLTGAITNSLLMTTIFFIDYFIALTLTMLYSKTLNIKKGES